MEEKGIKYNNYALAAIAHSLRHSEQAHSSLRVIPDFRASHHIHSILLGLQPGGYKVSITHPLTVVNTGREKRVNV